MTDIGEGISEVQVIQWFVSEGAHVEEWSPLLEVQSDKAADTITARFAGVVKKLYAKQDDTVKTGGPLCDIELESDGESEQDTKSGYAESSLEQSNRESSPVENGGPLYSKQEVPPEESSSLSNDRGKHATLATPAVRGLLKEHGINISDVNGTGKDGRVLKEDVQNCLSSKASDSSAGPSSTTPQITEQTETLRKLTPLQATMFRTMTASLQIPHFLFSDDINITSLSHLRQSLNTQSLKLDPSTPKLTFLPFIIKALSLSLHHYPILNSRLDLSSSPPCLAYRSNHNIGIALDTPQGLLVPVIKSVQNLSITAISAEIQRLALLGRANKLTTTDLTGGTITVSNVGSLSGNVVAPVIVEGQTAIIGVGKARSVPVFNERGEVVRAEMVTMSWSADHRVVDGGTVARASGVLKGLLEEVGRMSVEMR